MVTRSSASGVPEGWIIQLPTEAQWEHAAHPKSEPEAGSRLESVPLYPWGEHWKEDPCANCAESGLPVVGPTPVGLFWGGSSRRFKLWDVAGNLSELCLDGFGPYSGKEATDPVCDDYRHGLYVRAKAVVNNKKYKPLLTPLEPFAINRLEGDAHERIWKWHRCFCY